MKKLTLLVLSLIIAACGATSGGPSDRFTARSSTPYFYTTKDAADSNKKVTNMRSEIAVCNGECKKNDDRVYGTNHPSNYNLYRGSTYRLYNGDEYDIYDLSDTEFSISDGTTFTFVIDNTDKSETYGQITGIKIDDTEYDRNGSAGVVFDNENNNFSYESFAKSKEMNMVYSDFGKIGTDKFFAGGYKDLRYTEPTTTMNFAGRAQGLVKNAGGSQQLDGTAILNFEAGDTPTETLKMTFNDWYNVEIINNDITFKDKEFSENNQPIVQITDFNDGVKSGDSGVLNKEIFYYGAKNGADYIQEATGSVKYNETDGLKMDVVFGTQKIKD